jgi:hypothetical protein
MAKSPLTKKELFELLREQITHEDSLVNQRLNWLLLSQAFLFAAFTSLITGDIKDSNMETLAPFGIAIVGGLFSIYSFNGLRAAYMSLRNLRETWYAINGQETEQGIQKGFPKITWTGKKGQKAIKTATSTPAIILTIWWLVAMYSVPSNIPWANLNITEMLWIPRVILSVIYVSQMLNMSYATQNN